ncbi:MAG TPA: ATP-binding cassette domain-containing protein, partial [Candidatus Saccharimonadales bacterium]
MKQNQSEIAKQAAVLLKLANGDLETAVASLRAEALKARRRNKPSANPLGPVLVRLEHISKTYKAGRQKVAALRDVSLEIHEGEFVAFTGPSGSGKSTLLQIVGGLDKADEGSVTINGHDIAELGDRELSEFRNRTIGFVFQFFYLQPFLSLQANLAVPGIFARMKPAEFKARSAELAAAV